MNKDLRISIITPVYNQVKFIEETINSVLDQDYPNLEYIIIDGGSTDGTVDIIKKYSDKLTYWISESDEGIYDALQKGFDKCTGDILAWIGSDDKYHYGSFNIVNKIFTKFPNINWLLGATVAFDQKGNPVYVKESAHTCLLQFILRDNKMIQQESVFWRRSLWNTVGGKIPQIYKYAGDQALWARFIKYESLYVVNALLGGFRHREGQISKLNKEKYEIESKIIKLKLYEECHELQNKIRIIYWMRKLLKLITFMNRDDINKFTEKIFSKWYVFAPKVSFDLDKQEFVLE